MKQLLLIISFLSCFILFGCDNELGADNTNKQDIEVKNISANNIINQEPSNKAKELLIKHDAVTGIKAANTTKKLIVAVEIQHSKRFQLKQIKKKLMKELKNNFNDYKVELTIDKKIYLELEKLEEQIQSQKIKPDKLKKEIDRITKLSKEKT